MILSKEKEHKIRTLFVFACLLCSLPIILTTYPPMVDIPQHAAQISFINAWSGDNLKFKDLFELNPFAPYWLGYGIVLLFAQLTSVITSIKIVIAIALVSFPLSCALFRKETNIPAHFDWLFLPLVFGFAYDWGFFNFLIGAPVGMIFLRDVLRYQKGIISPWRIALWVNFLFFTHILIMLFFCTLGFLLLLPNRFSIFAIIKKSAPLFASVPLTLIWFLIYIKTGQSQEPGPWGLGVYRIHQFLPNMLSLPETMHFISISILLCALPLILGKPISRSFAKLLPFAFYLLWMLLAPNYLFGNFFTYNRFGMFGLPLYFLMFDYDKSFYSEKTNTLLRSKMKFLIFFVSLVGVLLLTRITMNSLIYERESIGYQYISKHMQPKKRVLTLVFNNRSSIHNNKTHANFAPVFLHYPVWYQAEKLGLVDYNFASFDGMIVHYKTKTQPTAGRGFEWMPHRFDWDYHNAHLYDYFVIKANTDLVHSLQNNNPEMKLVTYKDDWWLFEYSNKTTD